MSFILNLDGYKDEMHFEFLKIYKQFLQEAYTQVAVDTPVDTGAAQASWWIVQEGQSLPRFNPEKRGIQNPPSLYWMTWQNNNADIASPAPYMVYLNEGWSQQAPTNFVELAIESVASRY